MPRYDFKCESCAGVREEFFHVADLPTYIPCGCGGQAVRQLSAGISVSTFKPFESVAMGCPAWEAAEARRDHMGNVVRDRENGSVKILCPRGHTMNPRTGNIMVNSTAEMKDLHAKADMEPNW